MEEERIDSVSRQRVVGWKGAVWRREREEDSKLKSRNEGNRPYFWNWRSFLLINKVNFNHEARGSNKIDGCRGGEYVGCFLVF